jgi:tRNA-specific 2-thiouridylase
MCNRDVKFGVFYEFAKQHGADHIATGHYAQQAAGKLLRGVDAEKDQSYFLWAISKEALAMTLFPLGGMHKPEVRARAERFGLPNAAKKDSQGICFLGPVSMDDFLRAELDTAPGKALDAVGNEVGSHDGVLLATLGERIALTNAHPGPWYVLRKDIPNNVLVVSKERTLARAPEALRLASMNWFTEPGKVPVSAQYRYHGPRVAGHMHADTFTPTEALSEPIAAGQSLVLYQGDEVLGGGIIG